MITTTTTFWNGFKITEGYMNDGIRPVLRIDRSESKARFPKPLVNSYFTSVERKEAALEVFKASQLQRTARREQAKAEKRAALNEMKAAGHGIQVGDCLYASWGYEQTNIDYYQVVKVSASSVWFRAIGKQTVSGTEGSMSCQVTPCKDAFYPDDSHKAGVFCRKVRVGYRGQSMVSFDRQSLSKCEWSDTHYRSWYH